MTTRRALPLFCFSGLPARVGLASVMMLASLSGGCGHGSYTSEHANAAELRMRTLKSGVEWQMSQEQFLAGDLTKALRSVDASLALNPEVPKSHLLRGRIMLERGDLEAARRSLARAAELAPEDAEAPYYLGIVHERFGQFEEALNFYKAATTNDPSSAQYVVAAAEMLVNLQRYGEAEALLDNPPEGLTHSAAIRQCAGRLAMVQQQHERAVERLEQARTLAPDDRTIVEDLAFAYMAAGRFADAEHLAGQVVRLEAAGARAERGPMRERRDLQHLRARALMAMDRPVEARSIYEELTQSEDGARDVAAWIGLGKACAVLEDLGRLRAISSRIIAMDATRAEGYVLQAMFRRSAGEHEAALESLARAIELDAKSPEPWMLSGLIFQDLGENEFAVQAYREALSRNGGDDATRKLVAQLEESLPGRGTPATPATPAAAVAGHPDGQ